MTKATSPTTNPSLPWMILKVALFVRVSVSDIEVTRSQTKRRPISSNCQNWRKKIPNFTSTYKKTIASCLNSTLMPLTLLKRPTTATMTTHSAWIKTVMKRMPCLRRLCLPRRS
jgi:hypothetical protein